MFAFFLIATLVAVTSGLPLDSHPTAEALDGRIVGGKTTTIENYPYQVALESTSARLRCGGSIISEYVVLTAAHCVDGLYGPNYGYQIRAGTSYPGRGGSVHQIEKIIAHEKYDSDYLLDDVALIFVKEPFEIDSSRKAISLHRSTKEFDAGTITVITGFGRLRTNGALPEQLQVANVPYVTKARCDRAYRYYGGIGSGQICAGDIGVGGRDTCQGDSGGPLAVDGEIVGVVSYGVGCADPDYPGVYTEVAYFYDWIVENAGLEA